MPQPRRNLRALIGPLVLSALVALAGCRGGPTLADARDLLEEGDPVEALRAARAAVSRAPGPIERLQLRRVAFRAALEAGWSHEAAREYVAVRELLRGDEPRLLRDLGAEALAAAARALDASRRVAAVEAASAVPQLPSSQAVLRAALADPDDAVRACALAAAARLPDPLRARDLLLEQAAQGPSGGARQAALSALAQHLADLLEAAPPEPLLAAARAGLTDPDEGARLAAIDLLAALAAAAALRPAIVEALAGAVGNGADAVGMRAAEVLASLDRERALAAWEAGGAHAGPAEAFARALALSEDAPRAALAEVRADLEHPVYARRLAAARGLAGPRARPLADTLLTLLARDPATPVRLAALEALVAGAPRRLEAALERAARADAPELRLRAFVLQQERAPLSPERLVERFLAGDPALVDALATLLARRGDEASVSALLRGLDLPTTRLPALRALALRGDPAHRERFLALLSDPDPRVRREAAAGLARTGTPGDLALLVDAVAQPEDHTDLAAAAALLAVEARANLRPPAPPAAE